VRHRPFYLGNCSLIQLVSHELFQTNSKNHQNLSKGWGEPKKKFHCEYASSEGKKYI